MRFHRIPILTPLLALSLAFAPVFNVSAQDTNNDVKSTSGVHQAAVQVRTGSDGLTTEQRNIARRLTVESTPGMVMYLYIISPRTGKVLMYSGVDGKVTSSGKRLAPRTVAAIDNKSLSSSGEHSGIATVVGGYTRHTSEVLQDDGTYGDSVPYIYWWDTNGVYHQHFFTDGQVIHVSTAPIEVSSITLNLEVTDLQPAAH